MMMESEVKLESGDGGDGVDGVDGERRNGVCDVCDVVLFDIDLGEFGTELVDKPEECEVVDDPGELTTT
jgi:hypothetical protein